MKILLGGVILLAFFFWKFIWSPGRRYRSLFSDDHYLELLRHVAGLKQAALERGERPMDIPSDPRAALTRRGVLMFYTIEKLKEATLHHLSISQPSHFLAFAAGGRFLYMILRILGTLDKPISVARSPKGVTHGLFVLSDEEQARFAERSISLPTREDLPALKQAATGWLHNLVESGELTLSEEEAIKRLGSSLGIEIR